MAHSCPEIPVGAPLKAALDVATKHGPLTLANSLRRPWTSHGFQASWGIAARKAGIVGVTFHDLRGTAVTRLAIVGCTEAEIATITGHSLPMCARSSTPTICTAIPRSGRARSESSKGSRLSPDWTKSSTIEMKESPRNQIAKD